MAQDDYNIPNQSFPSFRSDLNSALSAINTTNSGTSRPSSAVAGTIWLDLSGGVTAYALKFFDGSDDITLANINTTANTVDFVDSSAVSDLLNDTSPQLGGNLDVLAREIITSTTNGNIKLTPDGTGLVEVKGATNPGSLQLNCENNTHGIKLTSPAHSSGQSYELKFPTGNVTANRFLKVASVSGSGTTGIGQLSFSEVSGGTSWQSVKTSNFTAAAGEGYFINTTSGGVTMTLPAGTIGDTIEFVDYAGTFGTNALTITPDGSEKIEASTGSKTCSTNKLGVKLIYSDATTGWASVTASREGTNPFIVPPYDIDFLVVAGGGSSGSRGGGGGGGGAGGYRTSSQSSIAGGNTITVTVGAGGSAPGTNNGSVSSIASSAITNIESAGGGFGASYPSASGAGGSGGGAADPGSAGAGNTPSVSPSQGNSGGNGSGASGWNGGGGGGAGGSGGNASGASGGTGGAGGVGVANSITGSSVYYAGGGGGASHNGTPGSGGNGGGGNGGTAPNSPAFSPGTANTGGGAGSGHGDGGSGVVILSVPDASYSGTTTGSPTVTTGVSGKTIIKFTGSGSYTT